MSNDFGVTAGHSFFSRHRFRDDVTRVVIYEDLWENTPGRTRYYLTDATYTFIQEAARKKWIRIIFDAPVIEGRIITNTKKKSSRRTAKKKEVNPHE